MRERAGALGGQVLLEAPPGTGRGTRLRFVLPVDGRRAGEGARA
jgi:signal transduction histidine kinase